MDRPVGLVSRPFWRGGTTIHSGLETRTAIGLLLAVILLTLIGWLYLDQMATITATRAEIRDLQRQREELRLETRYLQARISEQSSVDRLMRRAEALSLHEPSEILTLRVTPLSSVVLSNVPGDRELDGTALAGSPHLDDERPWWLVTVSGMEAWVSGLPFFDRAHTELASR